MSTKILITGGCGFVGSSLGLMLKAKYPGWDIACFDNLKRRGSELNIPRLAGAGIDFIHGDIRLKSDLEQVKGFDVLIDASAEPSVLAGVDGAVDYVVDTNLGGTINCLKLAAKFKAQFVFLSTSRVYPVKNLERISYQEGPTRFEILSTQKLPGVSPRGVSEDFPLDGYRSLYGATKLASELMIAEFAEMTDMTTVINRCGVITGPWQMGKVDQGVVVLWVARHFWKIPLQYIGYGGTGKQVRDILHIEDLFHLIDYQIQHASELKGHVFNVGGGPDISVSLQELTTSCQRVMDRETSLSSETRNRPADVPIYISDNGKIKTASGWSPSIGIDDIVRQIFHWIDENQVVLKPILSQ